MILVSVLFSPENQHFRTCFEASFHHVQDTDFQQQSRGLHRTTRITVITLGTGTYETQRQHVRMYVYMYAYGEEKITFRCL